MAYFKKFIESVVSFMENYMLKVFVFFNKWQVMKMYVSLIDGTIDEKVHPT